MTKAKLPKGSDAKLKGLSNGSQLPSGGFFMRRIFLISILIITILSSCIVVQAAGFDFENTGSGLLGINYVSNSGKAIKLMIQKGTSRYYYDLLAEGTKEFFTLQMGSGSYHVSILENTSGNSYRYISRKTFDVIGLEDMPVHLHSVQNINWDCGMDAVEAAARLTEDKISSIEKVRAIYSYITENIIYDRQKSGRIDSGYLPDIEDTFRTKTGICYDYSSLFAAMLRSIGIPAKLVTGYTSLTAGYHAWNEVYIKETDEWITIDTTVDSVLVGSKNIQMIKDPKNFSIKYIY